ncbi:DUF7609 family protein [Enterobacter hormaechei]|uniref:DUF7609 family protein n=1 Tax=Enterobacter hormaechei TaxID=158836 RepID=UPI003D36707C
MSEALKQGITAHRLVENLMALEVGDSFSRSTFVEPDVRTEHLKEVTGDIRQRMASAVSSTIAALQSSGKKKFSRETHSGITSTGNYAVTLIITRTE